MKHLFKLLVFCWLSLGAKDTATTVFHPGFRSLQVVDPTNLLGQPIIRKGSSVSIIFDELAEDNRFLRYRLVHCNADWQPSSLSELDFLDGFNEGEINDYALSENTLAHYVNYQLTLPNQDIRPLASGNYLVEIYDENDPSTTLLQARFMVSEELADLDMSVTSRTDVDYNDRHQQVSVTANLDGAQIENPYTDLRLVVVQNGQTVRELRHPLSVQLKSATYAYQRELIFPAGNEFRRFDLANINYPGMGVESIQYTDPLYSAVLKVDTPKADLRYIYDQDQAGRYFPAEINAADPNTGADYVQTYFTLQSPYVGEIRLTGDLVIGQDPTMAYDEDLGAYVKTLLLKQGMYNYAYTGGIDGNHYETENEYTALLYYSPLGARADRLIATAVIHSGK